MKIASKNTSLEAALTSLGGGLSYTHMALGDGLLAGMLGEEAYAATAGGLVRGPYRVQTFYCSRVPPA